MCPQKRISAGEYHIEAVVDENGIGFIKISKPGENANVTVTSDIGNVSNMDVSVSEAETTLNTTAAAVDVEASNKKDTGIGSHTDTAVVDVEPTSKEVSVAADAHVSMDSATVADTTHKEKETSVVDAEAPNDTSNPDGSVNMDTESNNDNAVSDTVQSGSNMEPLVIDVDLPDYDNATEAEEIDSSFEKNRKRPYLPVSPVISPSPPKMKCFDATSFSTAISDASAPCTFSFSSPSPAGPSHSRPLTPPPPPPTFDFFDIGDKENDPDGGSYSEATPEAAAEIPSPVVEAPQRVHRSPEEAERKSLIMPNPADFMVCINDNWICVCLPEKDGITKRVVNCNGNNFCFLFLMT